MRREISVGSLRQNPTAMIRDVRDGAVYTLTDRGRPVAEISPVRASGWRDSDAVGALLVELGADLAWAREVERDRGTVDLVDPWDER